MDPTRREQVVGKKQVLHDGAHACQVLRIAVAHGLPYASRFQAAGQDAVLRAFPMPMFTAAQLVKDLNGIDIPTLKNAIATVPAQKMRKAPGGDFSDSWGVAAVANQDAHTLAKVWAESQVRVSCSILLIRWQRH